MATMKRSSFERRRAPGIWPRPPVVLCVGNFDGEFHKEAWTSIMRVYCEELKGSPPHEWRPWQDACRAANIKIRFPRRLKDLKWLGSRLNRTPDAICPIPLSDCGAAHTGDFRRKLLDHLDHLNVLAIISYSDAKNTVAMLRALGPLDVPVLVTLASIVNLREMAGEINGETRPRPSNILRLIPNNEQQAQTLTTAIRLSAVKRLKVFYYPRSDLFAIDLLKSVEQLLKIELGAVQFHASAQPKSLFDFSREESKKTAFLFICYYEYLKEFCSRVGAENQRRASSCRLFLTDASLTQKPLSTIWNALQSAWISYPAYRLGTFVSDSYRAVERAWFEGNSEWQWPPKAIIPFIERVRMILEDEQHFQGRYKFRDRENISGGYSVIKIAELQRMFDREGSNTNGAFRN